MARAESRARWGFAARGWARRRDELLKATMPVSAWLIDAIAPQPGHDLLELAAGAGDTGFLAAELIAPTGTLIVSDFSPEMLTAAQARAAELGITNARFKQVDLETPIDLPAASQDGILCRWGFMLLDDPVSALQQCRRLLKPGGRLALAAWTKPSDNPWAAIPHRALVERGHVERPKPGEPGQFAWAEEGVIAEQLESAGFEDVEVERVDFRFHHAGVDAWWQATLDLSTSFGMVVPGLPAAEQAELRTALERAAAAYAAPGEATLAIPACSWTAVARA